MNTCLQMAMPQPVQHERNPIDKMVCRDGQQPVEAWEALKEARMATMKELSKGGMKRPCGLSKRAVYTYVAGKTHRHSAKEKRGRPGILTKEDVTSRDSFKCGVA